MRSHAVVLGALALVASAAPAAEPIRTVTDVVDVAYTVWVDQAGNTVSVDTVNIQIKTTRHNVAEPTPAPATVTSVIVPAETAAPAAVAAAVPDTTQQQQQVQQVQQPAAAAYVPSSDSYSNVNAPNGADYVKAVLDHHNAHRANHSAPALTWSDAMANFAYQTASSCKWGHDTSLNGAAGYGQNIEAGTPASKIGEVVTNAWYSEEQYFEPFYGSSSSTITDNLSMFMKYGHFTQVVWTDTTQVGCASFDCSSKGGLSGVGGGVSPTFTVCNYYPPGNYGGQYAAKVKPPIGMAPISPDLV